MQHFLNIRANDLSLARSYSLLQPKTPQPFPRLLMGTNPLHQFFQHANGTIVAPDGATLRATLADALGAPSGGTFIITADGDVAAVDASATAEDIASAFNGLDSITADGGVNVEGTWPAFLIAYRETGVPTGFTVSGALLTPNASAEMTVLTAGSATERELVRLVLRNAPLIQTTDFEEISSPHAGWEGRMPLNTSAAAAWILATGERFGNFVQAQTLLTVEVIDDDGNSTPLYQAGVVVRASNYDIAVNSTPFMPYFTAKPDVTGLVSASANSAKLGGLATLATINTGTTVRLIFTGDVVVDFRLFASTASESWPFIIRPYDYNASTNARQWALVEVRKAAAPCVWNPDTSLFHFAGADGAANAVSLEVDQTGFALPA